MQQTQTGKCSIVDNVASANILVIDSCDSLACGFCILRQIVGGARPFVHSNNKTSVDAVRFASGVGRGQ